MENFSLFNLLRALGSANAGGEYGDGGAETDGERRAEGAQDLRAEDGRTREAGSDGAARGGKAPPPPRGGQTNVLATVLERHEKIANRIKNRPPRPPR